MNKELIRYGLKMWGDEIVEQVKGMQGEDQTCNISDLQTSVESFTTMVHKLQDYGLNK